MQSQSAAARYLEETVENAPPLQLLRMLYQGAQRFLAQARMLDGEKDPIAYRDLIGQADAIVSELRCSLNHEVAPDFSAQLDSLYVFVQSELVEATISYDPKHIDAATRILGTLLDGWMRIELDPREAA